MLTVLLSGMISFSAFAEDVYVTKSGKKYHKEDSRFTKGKEVTKMDRKEAEEKGYEPSSDFLQDEVSDKESK